MSGPGAYEVEAVVPTDMGELGAVVRLPASDGDPLPGVVLVDGAGEEGRFDWGCWPECVSDAGSVVLRHDKPGCGGSPGHWIEQTIPARARESLAAVHVLRQYSAVAGQPVGLYGVSQGGWVALCAAALEPETVDFVVCHSGPGTTPAQQERTRLESQLRADGHTDVLIAEAMGWVDARADMILQGAAPESVLAEQTKYADKPWYPTVLYPYHTPAILRFARNIFDFDPATVMSQVRCPVLAMFGGADPTVPVHASLRGFADYLHPHPEHGIAVFPNADHGLFVAQPTAGVARRDQTAPAYMPTITAFLDDRRSA